jgi:hypothetical protein
MESSETWQEDFSLEEVAGNSEEEGRLHIEVLTDVRYRGGVQ